MTATMKSRVLVREEKGMGGISMKRLVFCGMGAGVGYFIINLSPAQFCSVPALVVLFILLIFMSGRRYGVARYDWLLLTGRGRLLTAARRTPSGTTARIGQALNLETQRATINGLDLFKGGNSALTGGDLRGIQILDSDAAEAGGYEIVAEDDVILEAV